MVTADENNKGGTMNIILIIGIIILVFWLLGFIFFKTLGWIINIALIIGAILIIIWLLLVVLRTF